MEVYAIPIDDKYIIYRPLLRMAFVGNRAMVDLALRLAEHDGAARESDSSETIAYLQQIGFLQPDPTPPPLPGQDFRPTMAVLLMTNRCNLRCVYCYANAGEMPPQDLSLDLAYAIIDQAHQNAVDQGHNRFDICFHGGGEPTYNWSVIQAATRYARDKTLPCRISTVSNGVWSPTQRAWIIDNLDDLTISLDGGPDTQNYQRPLASGEASSAHVMRTIRALDEAGFSYGIRMTATAPWRDRFPEDVRFICENTSCHTIQVEPAFNTQRGEHQESNESQSAEFAEAFLEAFEIAVKAGRHLVYSGARPWLVSQTFCSAPYNALIVNADGNLVTCYEIASDDHVMSKISIIGQVEDTPDGSQVVIDHAARNTIHDLLAHKKATQCRDCFARWSCAGDCYTRSFVADGDTIQPSDARCATNRKLLARLLLWNIMANDGLWRGQRLLSTPFAQTLHQQNAPQDSELTCYP